MMDKKERIILNVSIEKVDTSIKEVENLKHVYGNYFENELFNKILDPLIEAKNCLNTLKE